MSEVRGHLAVYGACPYCGTIQTERLITQDFVRHGGVLPFQCMKCVAKFELKWEGLEYGRGDTVIPT